MDQANPTLIAGRAVISDPPGGVTTIALYSADNALAELQLGPAEAVALASDLLLSARARYGRAHKETGQ